MKAITRPFVFCAVALLLTAVVFAGDKPAGKKTKKQKRAPPVPAAFKLPSEIQLSPEQQAKLDELKTQYGTKLTDAEKKVTAVYTQEQRAAQQAARKEAAAAGKKGKELKAAVASAVQLTDEQKQNLATAQAELSQLSKEVRPQVLALLTAEQRQSLKGKNKK